MRSSAGRLKQSSGQLRRACSVMRARIAMTICGAQWSNRVIVLTTQVGVLTVATWRAATVTRSLEAHASHVTTSPYGHPDDRRRACEAFPNPVPLPHRLRATDPGWGPRCLFRVELGEGAHTGPAGRYARLGYEAEVLTWALERLLPPDAVSAPRPTR